MLSGLAVCGWYMIINLPVLRQLFGVTMPLADCRWLDIDAVAAGVFGVPVGAAVLVIASLCTRAPGPEQAQSVRRMRLPSRERPGG